MDGRNLALYASRRRAFVELHLSTLGGPHVIPPTERNLGNVFQSAHRDRWESPGVLHTDAGDRWPISADGREWGTRRN